MKMKEQLKVVINADDFGINEDVTCEIEKMIDDGCISSTTIMANGQCLNEVKQFAALHPEISFGIHFCLSEFRSITNSEVLKSFGIVNEDGDFVHKQIFRKKHFDKTLLQAIKEELLAQIDIIKGLNVPISHADSHHHVHTIPQLQKIFIDVLLQNGIQKVRLGHEFKGLRAKRHLVRWFNRYHLNARYKSIFRTTDEFMSYSTFCNYPRSKCSTIELMCHPGHPGSQYMKEMELVKSKNVIILPEIKLINYNEL